MGEPGSVYESVLVEEDSGAVLLEIEDDAEVVKGS